MAKDTPEKESVGSIRQALESAYDAELAEPTEEVEEVAEPEKVEGSDEGRARGPDGKFVKKEGEEELKTDEAQVETPAPEAIEPEEHWSEADKAAFRAENAVELRKWFKERYKRIEADHTRKSQEAASLRSYKQQLDAIIEPYRQDIGLSGMDEVGAIRYLFSVRDAIQKNPVQGLTWLAQQYGVDLSQLANAPQPDPAVQAVNQQVAQISTQFQQLQQSLQQDKMRQAQSLIDNFAAEKDGQGNPKHPHFETVVDTMTQLMKSGMVQLGDLEGAYSKAVLFHGLKDPAPAPQARPVEKPEDKKQAELDKAAAAAKAKKAAAGVSGGSTSKTDKKMTLREELEARYEGNLQ